MASIFWDSQGVIMIDYLEQCRTINGAYFAGVFIHMSLKKSERILRLL